jgi:hypothetical protein
MDSKIACNVELFDSQFNCFIYKDGVIKSQKIPAANAYAGLVEMCHREEIYNISLSGDKTFLDGFIEQIYTSEATLYGKTGKIKIEVID